MLIERAQAQGRDSNITICHVLLKKAILLHKRPKVSHSFWETVDNLKERTFNGRFFIAQI